MPKFRKRPVEIEARQWDGKIESAGSIINWILSSGGTAKYIFSDDRYSDTIQITTLEGDMQGSFNDWFIKGIKGEFYPCKPEIFESTYEEI